MVNPEAVAAQAAAEGPDAVRNELRKQAEVNLKKLDEKVRSEIRDFMKVLVEKPDITAYLNSPELIKQDFRSAMPVLVSIVSEEKINGVITTIRTEILIVPSSQVVDAMPLNKENIRTLTGKIRDAIRKLRGPNFTVVMKHPGGNADEVLKALKANPPERLVVICRKGQTIGSAWRGIGVPVTSMAAGRQSAEKLIKAAVSGAKSSGEDPFGFWTEPLDMSQLKILSVFAEIGKLSDRDLQELVCMSAMLLFRIHAGLSKSEQAAVLTGNADPILHKLQELGINIPGLMSSKNGVFSFQLSELVSAFEARESVETAA
jgi:hypothetical protein